LTTIGLTSATNSRNASPIGVGAARQNRLFVGLLPTQTPIIARETRLPGLVVDPGSFGLRGPSQIWIGKVTLDACGPFTISYTHGLTQANILARGSAHRDLLRPSVIFSTNFGNVFDSSGTGLVFKSNSHEVKANFELGGSVTDFAGVNFTHTFDIESNASEFAAVNSLVEPGGASIFPVAPGLSVRATTPLFARTTHFKRVENVFSAVGSAKWEATDRLSLTLEGRYTDENQCSNDLIARDFGGLGSGFIAQTSPSVGRDAKFFTPRGSLDADRQRRTSAEKSVDRTCRPCRRAAADGDRYSNRRADTLHSH